MSVSALTSVAGLTLSAGLLVAVPGAQAAASTCRGLPVTIEGASNSSITGTPGDDVILAPFGSYGDLDAGAGDDVVCVVPGALVSGYPDVQYIATGGPGDDVIDSTALSANQYGLRVYESAGRDTVVGGAAPEFAFIEIVGNVRVVADTEPDVFSMGAGRDEVMSGEPGVPNGDVIDMGPGEDIVLFAGSGVSPSGLVDGGEGRDLLIPTDFDGVDSQTEPLPPGDAVFDARTGEATVGGVPYLSWAGIESYGFGYVRNRVTFRGSNGPEWLSLRNSSEQDVDMGGGRDVVVEGYAKLPPGVVRGGDGRDRIRLDLEGRASLDLRGSAVMVDEDGVRHEAAVDGFEDAQLQASVVKLHGTAGANVLGAGFSHQGEVWGGRGHDRVRLWFRSSHARDGAVPSMVRGGAGNDEMWGTGRPDILLGGPGQDIGHGRGGLDRCAAETRFNCELP